MAKKEIALQVVTEYEPLGGSIIRPSGADTVAIAGPDTKQPDMCCGRCGASLVVGMPRENIRGVFIRCSGCNASTRHSEGKTIVCVTTIRTNGTSLVKLWFDGDS